MSELNSKNTEYLTEEKLISEEKMIKTGEINSDRKPKINIKKNILRRNNIHTGFGHQIKYSKKLSCELDSLPSDINKFFRKSLNKYKFQMEVYVPHSMRISKKEYYDKNYMLNNLVKTQFKIEGEKNKILHISKETKKFSKQYKLVKNDNKNKQKEYLLNLENEYKQKMSKEIKYKKDENIFTPSFLLDVNYGNNLDTDAYKYGQNNDFYLEENKRDKFLLKKFYDVINRKDKKEKNQNLEENSNEEDDKIAKLKKELNEQIRIENMTKREYHNYSKQLKKEIKKIKTMLDDDDIKDYYTNNKNKDNLSNVDKKDLNKLSPEKIKRKPNITNYKFKYPEKNKSKDLKDIKKRKNKKIFLELNNSNNNSKKKRIISENKNNNSSKKEEKKNNLIDKIPKLTLNKINLNNVNKIKKRNQKQTKEFQLNQLYNTLSERKSLKYSEMPYKQMNKYFMKYNPKILPVINIEKGSNIHGLVESAQKIINENNIVGFSKLNDILKKDMFRNNNYKFSNIKDETENIITLDNRILDLHFEFADTLLSNKRDKFLNYYKK